MDRPSPTAFDSVLIYTCEDTVGDGIVKLPFVRAARGRLPAARLVWCAGRGPTSYAGVLAPLVAGLIDETIANAGIGSGPFDCLSLSAPLGGRRFGLVIDTQRALTRTLAVRRIRHGLFVSGTSGYRLSDRRPAPKAPEPRHLVRYLIGLLDLAAPPSAREAPVAPLALPEELQAAARAALPDGPAYVGFAPGAGDKAKIWPRGGFVELARRQVARGRVPVFFLGPEECAWLDELRAAVPEARFPEWEDTAQAAGARGPVFAIALAARLAGAVANDSGAGHMLAAGGTALVSLFSKHDPAKYAPTAARLEIVDSKAYGGTDPALIPADAVDAALERLLGRAPV